MSRIFWWAEDDDYDTFHCQKIEEMRLTIEELEMLKELADELEEQHVEAEKALQEEIGEDLLFVYFEQVVLIGRSI